MINRAHRRGSIRQSAFAAVALVACFAGTALVVSETSPGQTPIGEREPFVPPAESLYSVLDMDFEALAAARVSSAAFERSLVLLREALQTHGRSYSQSTVAFLSAQRSHDLARRLAHAGKGSVQDVQRLTEVLASARASRDAVLGVLRNAASSEFTEPQREVLAQIARNQAHEVPVQFKVVNRTAREWIQLRDAIAARAASQVAGGAIASPVALMIAESDPRVQRATANLAAVGDSIIVRANQMSQPGPSPDTPR